MSGILHRDMSVDLVAGRALYLPTSSRLHNEVPVGRCDTIVTADGDVCGTVFFDRTKWLRHVANCARQHASAIHAYRRRQHPEIMNAWDPELEAWMRQHADAVLRGAKRV